MELREITMANHVNRNNFDENAEDIHNDVSQSADTLEEVLKSWAVTPKRKRKRRVKAQSLLKTRARLNGHNRCSRRRWMRARQRAMRWAVPIPTCKPWHSGPPPPSGYLLAYCSIYVDKQASAAAARLAR